MGLIWQQEGNGEKAVASYTKATQYDPKLVTAWVNLTSACIMTGDFKKALEAAKAAVALEPDFGIAQNNMAVALYFNKEYAAARQHLDRAKELGYKLEPRFEQALAQALAQQP